ncbi:MAG: amino acid ABC transporter ATP-binding protein [Oscillospiraceae bacterium]|nr:amino acid ABC transporter ATP-binding protein [Oscillospiraceae bacterium]
MIKISHLKKAYPNVTPLKDVNVEIHKGAVISIIGPSGTGKSTLIRCINMLETPTAGEIWVDGECITDKKCNINKIRQKMGMVFQSFNLFHHMTIIENIMAAPMDLLGKSKQEAYEKGMELLRTVGLADKALNYPDELSGGQKQRVAIARALAMEPEIILLDEPTSALDPTMVGEVQAVIKDLAKKGLTLMIVTHEMRFAREIANRVFYMDEGGVYEDGTPEQIFDNPQKEKTIRFIKHLKVFETIITSKDFDFIGFNTALEEFGRKNQVAQRAILRSQAVFEELGVQIILPQLADEFKLSVALEYSQDEEALTMVLKYDGAPFDIKTSDNVLSLKLAQNASQSIEYAQCEGEGFTNLVTVKIK